MCTRVLNYDSTKGEGQVAAAYKAEYGLLVAARSCVGWFSFRLARCFRFVSSCSLLYDKQLIGTRVGRPAEHIDSAPPPAVSARTREPTERLVLAVELRAESSCGRRAPRPTRYRRQWFGKY